MKAIVNNHLAFDKHVKEVLFRVAAVTAGYELAEHSLAEAWQTACAHSLVVQTPGLGAGKQIQEGPRLFRAFWEV